MTERTYHGGCHCGALRYEADLDLDQGTLRCNCTLCSKARTWIAFTSADKFRLTHGQVDDAVQYRWTPPNRTEPNITYYSCGTCGVRTHARGTDPKGNQVAAIQVATIEDADPDLLAKGIRYVDGLHDRRDREPEDKRLL